MTPTAQVVALYAEYDSLLDALEAVQLQLRAKRCGDRRVYNALRVQVREICEALADVHEKIADFVILPRGGSIRWVGGTVSLLVLCCSLSGEGLIQVAFC